MLRNLVLGLAMLVLTAGGPRAQPIDVATRLTAVLPAFEAEVRRQMAAADIPGLAVVVATADAPLYVKGYGTRRLGEAAAVDGATLFHIGSLTKAFLATTAAIAVDDGVLGWSDPVIGRYPTFRLSDPAIAAQVTIPDILAHVVGLPGHALEDMAPMGYSAEQIGAALAQVPLVGRFRHAVSYNNAMHPAVGAIVATALAQPSWDAALSRRLLVPAGMLSSSTAADSMPRNANAAVGHRRDDGGKVITVGYSAPFWYSPAIGGAGALNATATDMGRWIRLQLGRGAIDGRRIVSPDNLAETWKPRGDPLIGGGGSALGWGVETVAGQRQLSHDGGTSTYGSSILVAPEAGFGICILTNLTNEGVPNALIAWLRDRLLDIQRPLGDFAGSYDSPTLGPVAIWAQPDRLGLKLESTGLYQELVPDGTNRFRAVVVPAGPGAAMRAEGFDLPYRWRFSTDAAGRIVGADAVGTDNMPHRLIRTGS